MKGTNGRSPRRLTGSDGVTPYAAPFVKKQHALRNIHDNIDSPSARRNVAVINPEKLDSAEALNERFSPLELAMTSAVTP
jgi:hypothetical protein